MLHRPSALNARRAAPPCPLLARRRKTGYGTYFSLPGRLHGARVIQLRAGESAARSETWIRNELGEREDQVS